MRRKTLREIKTNPDGSFTYIDTKIPIFPTVIYIILFVGISYFTISGKLPIFPLIIVSFLLLAGGIGIYKLWKDCSTKGGTPIITVNKNGVIFHLKHSSMKSFFKWDEIEKVVITEIFYIKIDFVGKNYINTMLFFIKNSTGIYPETPKDNFGELIYTLLAVPEKDLSVFVVKLTQNSLETLPELIKNISNNIKMEKYKELIINYRKQKVEYKI